MIILVPSVKACIYIKFYVILAPSLKVAFREASLIPASSIKVYIQMKMYLPSVKVGVYFVSLHPMRVRSSHIIFDVTLIVIR